MKFLRGILFFLFWPLSVCFSQTGTFQLTKLPPDGILLDKDWKFHAGDDSAWANPEFNDSVWQPINPSLDIRHIPEVQNEPIFWLRLKLMVDSSLLDQPLGMAILQVGASEIYLDSALIYKFGTVSKEIDKLDPYFLVNRPFSIKLGAKKIQTIAVRYSYNPKAYLIKWGFENSCLHVVLNSLSVTFSTFQKNTRVSLIYEMSQASLWLLFCIISFGLYFSIRSQKEYLLIGVYSFSVFCSNILGGLIARELINTTLSSYTYFVSRVFLMVGVVVALSAIYRLFHQNKNWYYYTLMLGSLFGISSFFLFYDQAMYIYLVIFILYGLEFLRRSWMAVRHRRPGSMLLLMSAFSFILLVALFVLLVKFNYVVAATFCGFLAGVILPFSWSLFIAGEFGRTGLALKERVKEIELLSQRAVAQEREKQQFLANQNETLEIRVSERTAQLNESLINLQTTQTQLIQSEKMASLGELTAGIAHEIQNPLNFVNNFSEVNTELIDELQYELKSGNANEAISISESIKENEQKISQHGKRADAIVKGMLQHSRSSNGIKEPININELADEYLRLSYRGMRAKDNSFNATINTEFDDTIGNINAIPQDMGRVLLNLYNNAFYAVSEQKKSSGASFEPTVLVSTKKIGNKIEIKIKDNGVGIPEKIQNKIFQPFFTTKPTGQGTGLGLSLSYDIVKAHGGALKAITIEGQGAEFVVQIPLI